MESRAVKLSTALLDDADKYAQVFSRSIPKQIEHWVKIGKIAEENPDMPYELIKDILLGLQEATAGNLSEYRFD
ncbi:hypothetical protein AGMMS49546_22770 [Spirochaetia bacterium]|nr:hypothetical protein AGMMS49546_22770 [Spirochaetia bacterium]